ncbi:MAG: hypothetical protein H7096_10885 [Flavobacterium sp.]|nr:hypothetical protein [Pedobacter sp.]
MKTQIISAISGCLFSLMVVNSASAQQPKTNVLPQVTITSPNAISERVLRNFARSFKDASQIRWIQLNDRFLVNFNQNDMNHKALYKKGGYMVYHVGYGFENNLPAGVKSLVKSHYSGYTIYRSFIFDQANRYIWIVGLQSPSEYIQAAIENDKIIEMSRMQNASPSGSVTSMIKKQR